MTNGVTAGDGTLFKVSSGSSATFFGTYNGTGVSGIGNVYYEADVSPGFSPASINYGGNVNFDSTSRLIMQLGGTTVGSQFDKVNVAGQLALSGTLDLQLINSFSPTAGNKFDILDWSSLSGHFSSVSLPALSAGLAWDSAQLYTSGTLDVVNINFLPGDFNRDRHVDAADILAAMKALTDPTGYEAQYSVSAATLQIIGDVNGDTQFTNADLQSLLIYLKDGGGSISTVPEPASWVLAFLAFAMASGTRFSMRCVR